MSVRRLGVGQVLSEGRLIRADLLVDDDRIIDLVAPRPGAGGIASPGFVDLQINGFAGADFATCDAAAFATATRRLACTGVTRFLPTLISADPNALRAALARLADFVHRSDPAWPRPVGVHLEGPFLAPERLGTHPAEARRDPDPVLLRTLLASGPVRLVTLAPELPGALELVRFLRSQGIAVSAGHTDATAEEARRGFAAGIGLTTHHGNAMRPFRPRDPGILGAALVDVDTTVTVIADNVHLAPQTLALFAVARPDRIALVTDATALAGTALAGTALDSTALGPVTVWRVGDAVRNGAGDLAGSVLTMDVAVRNLVAAGIRPERALAAASTTPARAAGLPPAVLSKGQPPDVAIVDDTFEILRTVIRGRVAYER